MPTSLAPSKILIKCSRGKGRMSRGRGSYALSLMCTECHSFSSKKEVTSLICCYLAPNRTISPLPPSSDSSQGSSGVAMMSWAGSSDTVFSNEGEDVILRQFLRILTLLRVMYSDTITPFPEEPPIVADVKWSDGVHRHYIGGKSCCLVEEKLPVRAFAECHGPGFIRSPNNVEASGHKVSIIPSGVAESQHVV